MARRAGLPGWRNTGRSHSSGLKGHPFSQPGLKALDIGGVSDVRAESPAIRWSMSLGECSNGQPVGPLDLSEPGTRAFSPGWENDRPFGPEETPFFGFSLGSPPGNPCHRRLAAVTPRSRSRPGNWAGCRGIASRTAWCGCGGRGSRPGRGRWRCGSGGRTPDGA